MYALFLVLAIVSSASARDNSAAAESFRVAARHASDSVGTSAFPKALLAAELACDDKRVPGCAVTLEALEAVNASSRRAPASVPVAAVDPEPIAEPVRASASGPRVVMVGQSSGLDYVGGKRRPSSLWTGLELINFQNVIKGVEVVRVCVMMDGAPIPMGPEVPFSHVDRYGSPVYGCPAASVAPGEPLYVPAGATIHVATTGLQTRDVFVIKRTYRCEQSQPDVQRKSVTSCHGG